MKKNLAKKCDNVPKIMNYKIFHKVNYSDYWKMALLDFTFVKFLIKNNIKFSNAKINTEI